MSINVEYTHIHIIKKCTLYVNIFIQIMLYIIYEYHVSSIHAQTVTPKIYLGHLVGKTGMYSRCDEPCAIPEMHISVILAHSSTFK